MLRFADGFDHYATADAYGMWDEAVTSAPAGISVGSGRFGGNAWVGTHRGRWLAKHFDTQPTWIVGVAFRGQNVDFSGGYRFITLYSGVDGLEQISVRGVGGKLVISRNGTTLATGTTTLKNGYWYYIEFKATIHNSTGSAEIRLDGRTECSVSGTDTQAGSVATATRVYFTDYQNGFGQDLFLDDVYICDGVSSGVAGAPNNDFLGDTVVELLQPSGNGNSSQFNGSDGNSVDNYLLVDEAPPNYDTDYVESNTAGNKDTYLYDDSAASGGVVYGVVLAPWLRKTDAGVRKICGVTRLSGTEEDSADFNVSATWAYILDIRESDPFGNQWTIPNVNSMEAGAKVTA